MRPPTRITLICHPATPQQKAGIFPSDESLDVHTLETLSAIPWRPSQSVQALTAPELRTRQTAAALGLDAVEAPELRECDFGLWRGLSLEALSEQDPHALSAWIGDIASNLHQGESHLNLIERAGNWLESQRDAGHVVVVTHASVIRAVIVHALQAPPQHAFRSIELSPLTVTDIRLTGGVWRVRSVGVPLATPTQD